MTISANFENRLSGLNLVTNVPLAIAIFGIFSIIAIFIRPLLPIDETRYLSVAWEMWLSGNYFVPTLNGDVYSHKPPLLFWLINLIWSITGVSEFSARLIGPIAGCISILLTVKLAKILWPEKPEIAGRASLILATTSLFLLSASLTMFDALLTVGVLTSVIGLLKFAEAGGLIWILLFAFGIAFGVLAKGPVVLLHVFPVILVLSISRTTFQNAGKTRWLLSLLIGLIIAILLVFVWLLPAITIGGVEYRDAILWKQTAGRITKSFAHQRPFWFYFALLPVLLWPWIGSPFLWNKQGIKTLAKSRNGVLCAFWFASIVIFFSAISGKQPHYLLPALPIFALLLGFLYHNSEIRGIWALGNITPLVGVLLILGFMYTGQMPIRGAQHFSSLTGIVVILGSLALCGFLGLRWRKSPIVFAFLAPLLMFGLHLSAVEPINKLYESAHIGKILRSHQDTGIAYIGKYHGEFNFSGRLTQSIAVLKDISTIDLWAKSHPGGAIIGMTTRTSPQWSPQYNFPFRNRPYALWIAPKEPK